MIETKLFEIRDRGTFIPALAVKIANANIFPPLNKENFLLSRAGYVGEYILLTMLEHTTRCFGYSEHWGHTVRTMRIAHQYIEQHFDTLDSGAVIDVEYILGETASPKASEYEKLIGK